MLVACEQWEVCLNNCSSCAELLRRGSSLGLPLCRPAVFLHQMCCAPVNAMVCGANCNALCGELPNLKCLTWVLSVGVSSAKASLFPCIASTPVTGVQRPEQCLPDGTCDRLLLSQPNCTCQATSIIGQATCGHQLRALEEAGSRKQEACYVNTTCTITTPTAARSP